MIYQNTYIAQLKAQLSGLRDSCEKAIQPLTKNQLNWQLSKDKWSIAQILDHLNIVNKSYMNRSTKVVEELNTDGVKAQKFASDYYGNMAISLISADNKIKTKTIKEFTPTVDVYEINIKEEFCHSLIDFKEFIGKIEAFDLNKGKVKFVDDNFIKVNLGDVLKLVLVHMERHLQQVLKLKAHVNFPDF